MNYIHGRGSLDYQICRRPSDLSSVLPLRLANTEGFGFVCYIDMLWTDKLIACNFRLAKGRRTVQFGLLPFLGVGAYQIHGGVDVQGRRDGLEE